VCLREKEKTREGQASVCAAEKRCGRAASLVCAPLPRTPVRSYDALGAALAERLAPGLAVAAGAPTAAEAH
jgi:hypothetical protein